MQKTIMMFPDDSGIEIEVEYEVDKELYGSGVHVDSVSIPGNKKPYWFTEFLSDLAIEMIEKMIVSKFEDMKNARFALLAEERRYS